LRSTANAQATLAVAAVMVLVRLSGTMAVNTHGPPGRSHCRNPSTAFASHLHCAPFFALTVIARLWFVARDVPLLFATSFGCCSSQLGGW
jgi:hypothetical protein